MNKLKETILRAVEIYNRYRSPEAAATLLKLQGNHITIEFKGPFCSSCGIYDYFEGFVYELKDFANLRIRIVEVKQDGPEDFRVKYRVEGK
jgi:hypothetical protein